MYIDKPSITNRPDKPVTKKILDKVVCCSNNHRFRLGICGQGYRDCPECNHLLKEVHADVTKGEPFTLQYLWQVFTKKKEPKSSTRNLSIDVAMNTDKLQLKLRAIAKHTEALADELDAIDSNECTELSAKQIELLEHMIELNKQNGMSICSCDVERVLKLDDELSTEEE